MKVKEKRPNSLHGISLILLVITLVVSAILMATIILNLEKNDPRETATENVFKSDFRTLQDELEMKKVEAKQKDIIANINISIKFNDEENLKKWIPSIEKSVLNGIVEICKGELVFVNQDMSENEINWANDIGVIIDACE